LDIIQLLSVFGLSIIELWVAIPTGFAFNLNPAAIAVMASLGSIFGAIIDVWAGDKLRSRIIKWRYGENGGPKQGRLFKLWNRYGVVGLGLLSPLLLGAPLGVAVGLVFGAERWRLLLWISVGIIAWSILLTAIGSVSFEVIKTLLKWS
jgi:membrane protein YqaA with SNARE-associated domain